MMSQSLTEDQKFPFDISHIRRIQYENTIAGTPRLRGELSKTLDYVLDEVQKESSLEKEIAEEEQKAEDKEAKILYHADVGKRREERGIEIMVYDVDFGDDGTYVNLKVENRTEDEISFYISLCYAIQNRRQFRSNNSHNINRSISSGAVEEGWILFEALDHSKSNVMFYFKFSRQITIGIEVETV